MWIIKRLFGKIKNNFKRPKNSLFTISICSLLYYPPLVIDDENTENFKKGSSTYSHQKTNFDESKLGSLDLKDKDEEEATHINKDDVNKNYTRCGAHCVSTIFLPFIIFLSD